MAAGLVLRQDISPWTAPGWILGTGGVCGQFQGGSQGQVAALGSFPGPIPRVGGGSGASPGDEVAP